MSVADRATEWLPLLWFLFAAGVIGSLWVSGTLDRLFARLTRFGGFGLEFEFTEKSAQQTRVSVEEGLGLIRDAIRRKLAADAHAAGLQEAFRRIIKELPSIQSRTRVRATIHIPDPLYERSLHQLLDYEPKGAGAGRTFSTRTGIIGLAWRTLERHSWHQHAGITVDDLVKQWGMTPKEAEQREIADGKKLFLAEPLFAPGGVVPVGVFYLDVEDRTALGLNEVAENASDADREAAKKGTDEHLARIADEFTSIYNQKMSQSLADLVRRAKREGPQLELEGQ